MNTNKILMYIGIFCILLLGLKIYTDSELYHLKCIVSTVDGNKYCVRDKKDIAKSADLLATATNKCTELVKYLKNKYPNNEKVKRLVNGFNPKNINETLPTSELTAYSENKGEKIAFCLNKSKKNSDKSETELIDIDTLTFVALHELSHVMCKSFGHKQEFWQDFKFILENAKEANIHNPINYKKKPQEYCGMKITDNPFFDM